MGLFGKEPEKSPRDQVRLSCGQNINSKMNAINWTPMPVVDFVGTRMEKSHAARTEDFGQAN